VHNIILLGPAQGFLRYSPFSKFCYIYLDFFGHKHLQQFSSDLMFCYGLPYFLVQGWDGGYSRYNESSSCAL